ncbi:MAG: glycosyltransferase family 2 protein [Chromatiaceae bacterium]
MRESTFERGNACGTSRLGIVVPCFNEESVLPETARRLTALIERLIEEGRIAPTSKVCFVDDGSRDGTWALIERLARDSPLVSGIKLSRNRGHQNALLAGLFTADGDVLVSVDADLQDDIGVIPDMLTEYSRGIDIVYGVRKERLTDRPFKRYTAEVFYRLMSILGAESIYNHADFRLMSRCAVEALKQFREVNLFLRGLVPLVGFPSAIVTYARSERFAGESKYPLRSMFGLALDAVTSFSVVPLRLITLTGFILFILSAVMVAWSLWVRLFTSHAVPGWTSTILPIYLLGGVQILCVGIIGEYLGKVYQEVKARPRYIIEKMI